MASASNVYKPKLTGVLIAAILLVMVVIVILISTILILSRVGGAETTTAPSPVWTPAVTTTVTDHPVQTPSVTPDPTTPDPTTPDPTGPDTVIPSDVISISKSSISTGNLVQIDESHYYYRDGLIAYRQLNATSASALGFAPLSSSSPNYSLRTGNLYLTYDAVTAFEAMAEDLAEECGNALQVRNAYYYDANVTISNFKENLEAVEHSTGLYLDLQAYANGKVSPLNHPTYSATYYTWLTQNCWKYGYIHIRDSANYSTFRYVGTAPAAAMEKNGWNFTQFVQKIIAYNFDNPLKVNDANGREWWLYYVLADGDSVDIPVLGDESAYTISGDSATGFIVAINTSVFA